MKRLSLSRASLGVKLSVMTSLSVTVLFFILTLALSNNAAKQLQTLTLENMQNQVAGIGDMAGMFKATLSEEVVNYTNLFQSFLPKEFSLDENARVTVGDFSTPTLRAGSKTLNLDETVVEDFLARTGAIATIFVRDGDNFVRIATSLRKEDGSRAMGTQLDRQSPAFARMAKGEAYRGLATLFGKHYITQYQPVTDASGTVVGIVFVGVEIGKQIALMRDKILERSFGETGHFMVMNGASGAARGTWLFHPQKEGEMAHWSSESMQRFTSQQSGTLETLQDGEMRIVAWQHLPGWNWLILGDVDKNSLLAPITSARNNFLVLGLALVLLFAVGFVMITRRWVSVPLQQVIHLAEQYADGNLQATLQTQRKDEVGQLITAINGIGDGLERIVSQVRVAAQDISQGTDAIAMSSENISEQITRQASSVEETSASMEQLGATVGQNAENVAQALQLVAEAASAVQHGGETVAHSVNTMSAIKVSSQSIADITHVIESIAFQTNILALNAAVEAARAGEHGKGFAVVAAEVRALASRSAQAAKEIDALITKSIGNVNQGHTLSEQTRNAMENIITRIEQVKALMNEINIASQEQSAGINQVNIAMTQIGQATHQNTELVAQSEDTAHGLSKKGHHLTELVSVFNLKG